MLSDSDRAMLREITDRRRAEMGIRPLRMPSHISEPLAIVLQRLTPKPPSASREV